MPAATLDVLPHNSDWSDHAALALSTHYHLSRSEVLAPPNRKKRRAVIPPYTPTPLDNLLQKTLALVDGQEAQLRLFYGNPWEAGTPLFAYIGAAAGGVPQNGLAVGASVYWGPNALTNWSQRVPGLQTVPRASLWAVIHALRTSDPTRLLRLWVPDDYTARVICHWAPVMARKKWTCAHADLIKPLVELVQARAAAVRIYVYDAEAPNERQAVATVAAAMAATQPLPPTPLPKSLPVPSSWPAVPLVRVPDEDAKGMRDLKASTPLPPLSAHAEEAVRRDGAPTESDLTFQDVHWEDPGYQPIPLLSLRKWNLRKLLDATGPGGFWPAFHDLMGDRPSPPLVEIMQLFHVFHGRMNPPDVLPPEFDRLEHALNRLTTHSLPRNTKDTSAGAHFSRPFSVDEIEEVKTHIRSHNKASARGLDGVSYDDVLQIPSDRLCELFQACVDSTSAPHAWLTTIIAAVKKPKKDGKLPESYRTIGLESCLLKTLTLLIDRRLRAWAEDVGRIPDSQNGFRAGHRTFNNAFILRAAIEKARAAGKTLYVVFLDLANAFPSVDQSTLWAKLARWGVAGPLIDWLRMLYSQLQYLIRFGGDTTDTFKALMGILIGDPASPILWILYLSDFDLRPHHDDVILDGGHRVSHLEIADDIALVSYSDCGMQDKLEQTEDYCGLSCLFMNVPKTLASIHGPLPDPLPILLLYQKRLVYVDTTVYVGMSFCSTVRDIFLPHYVAKELAARRVGNACFALESYTGPLPPLMAIRLYLSHLDPHLTGGCEIALDVRPTALDALEMVQHIFLRRALHVSKRSQIAPLHSETGIWPLRFRRLELVLRFLRYLLTGQPALAYAALRESWVLATSDRGASTWWSDLTIAASMLPVPLVIPLHQWPTVEAVDVYIARIPGLVAEHLYTTILQSLRLPVMHRRVQFDCPERPLYPKLCCRREYLKLPHHRQRSAITLLLLSEHPLSVEQLRRGPTRIARELRICRWCTQHWAVEDETHVLLECDADALTDVRETFLNAVFAAVPSFRKAYFRLSSAALLDMLLRGSTTLPILASYVADVFELCATTPPLLPQDNAPNPGAPGRA